MPRPDGGIRTLHRSGYAPHVPAGCQECPIRPLTICQPLADSELGLVSTFKTGDVVLPAGSMLYRQGEPCSKLYNLLDGWVVVYRVLRSGRHQIVDFALPGRFLGCEPDLSAPMSYTAECLTDVAVCVFPRRPFPELVATNPGLAVRLAWLNLRDLMVARNNLTNVGARPADARIAHLLAGLCVRLRRRQLTPCSRDIEIPLTQNHIADALGLSNVYVSQTLKQLREQGVLDFKNRRLRILDLDGLVELAELDDLPDL